MHDIQPRWLRRGFLAAGLFLTTCAPGSQRGAQGAPESRSTPPVAPRTTASSSPTPSTTNHPAKPASDQAATWTAPSNLAPSPEGNAIPVLPRFYAALRQLELGLRTDHVRVAWLGNSHTQADMWTDAVRRPLQKRFGNGGPGFVHVGWTKWGYRHTGMILKTSGRWGITPPQLVSFERVGDGVFGLGGVRVTARWEGSVASVETKPEALPHGGRWELSVRFLRPNAWVDVEATGSKVVRAQPEPAELNTIQRLVFLTPGPGGKLTVKSSAQHTQLMGLIVEDTNQPGVVLDTLGLNSARVRSALAWDESAWVSELARRKPQLIIIAYGTNEAGHKYIRKEPHAEQVQGLLHRIRTAAPDSDCVVFGPIDRGDNHMSSIIAWLNEEQRAAAAEMGCAFWSGQTAMGGKGSMKRWTADSLGAGDLVHLSASGYRRLGQALARDMLTAYDAGRQGRGQ